MNLVFPEGLTHFTLYHIVNEWSCSCTIAGGRYIGWGSDKFEAITDCWQSYSDGKHEKERVAERNAKRYPAGRPAIAYHEPIIPNLIIDL